MSNKLRSIKRANEATEVELSPLPPELKADVDAMTAYIKRFIDRRFPEGLNEPLYGIMSEVILDAYVDGLKSAESQTQEESVIIQL
jgi:hypothetical protein